MKTRSTRTSADSLIQFLTTHTPILTDQGINVRGFIDQLTALKSTPAPPISPQTLPKSKSPKK